jgi:hypothetical protein
MILATVSTSPFTDGCTTKIRLEEKINYRIIKYGSMHLSEALEATNMNENIVLEKDKIRNGRGHIKNCTVIFV